MKWWNARKERQENKVLSKATLEMFRKKSYALDKATLDMFRKKGSKVEKNTPTLSGKSTKYSFSLVFLARLAPGSNLFVIALKAQTTPLTTPFR